MSRRGLLMLWGLLTVAAFVLPAVVPPSWLEARPPEKSPGILAYEIDARLMPRVRVVEASGELRWRNTSPDTPVTEMRLHLYLNAFKHRRTTFMWESKGSHRGHKFDPLAAGQIDLLSFREKDGSELIGKRFFWTGDDANPDDETVVVIPLEKPIAPGETRTFELKWKSKMPRVFARTGYGGPAAFFMMAQWYPKPGVWEYGQEDGVDKWCWNCHQFHGSSEFYADYGSYRVRMTVPSAFKGRLGATGKRVGEPKTHEDGSVTYEHHADHVHDFAWVCGEDFEVHEAVFEGGAGTDPKEQQRVARILGLDPSDLDLPSVTVHFLLQPEHADQLERHKRAVFHAITYMGFWFGNYPYPTLTVVDPDHRARDAGGMEYPTLITGGTRYIRAAEQLSPEGVLVHEFGHQHFYGLVGTNEFRHAWMDEGMCTYATGKVLMKAYDGWRGSVWFAGLPVYGQRPLAFTGLAAGSRKAMPFLAHIFDDELQIPFGEVGLVKNIAEGIGVNHPPKKVSLWPDYGETTPLSFLREIPTLTHLQPNPSSSKEHERGTYAQWEVVDPIAGRRAWQYMDRRSYGTNSYRRTANSLRTLEGLLGEETVVRIMRKYCEKYRFQHPGPEEFFAVAIEQAKEEGKGDIRWFFDTFFLEDSGFDFGIGALDVREVPVLTDKKVEKTYESAITVRRYGEARMPIDVRVAFEDGTVREFHWALDDSLREFRRPEGSDARVHPHLREWVGEPLEPNGRPVGRITPARGTQQKWAKLRFLGGKKATVAEADPFYAYSLDRNRLNDGRRAENRPGAAWQLSLRMMGWVEMSTSFYGGL